ncbi:MAG: hypothetical protein A3E83_01300 [Gammaproteobacteria bacterium RIFCSPHIGHO2_12_FULL_41_20]|nr:MAG: hypothetical protein A3E83_01300 [Gammaproteobacteria bacterium RIFCSPHIGHO2_12_FULL_41_20]
MFRTRKTHSHACCQTITGFQLIEMMMVITIISILAVMGIPLYSQHVIKVKRLEAKSMLLQLSQAMENYALHNHSYTGATLAALHQPEITAQQPYRLHIQYANTDGFLLMAQPQGKQAADDAACATLTLDDKGTKGITGTGLVTKCWG